MAWQAPRRKEHHVDADVVAGASEAGGEHFRGGGDAAKTEMVDGQVKVFGALAPLHFNEGNCASPACDQIDLARGDAQPLPDNPPAVEAQPPRRPALGLASPRFGGGAFQPASFSAKARA